MYSQPAQSTKNTQTEAQPAPPPICVPLLMVDEDGKRRYCYHGGKCRCEMCERIRQAQQDELDRNLDAFIPHNRLKLEPAIRQVKHKQYKLEATRVSPEYGLTLLKDHLKLVKDNPTYYLPYKYYLRDAWRVVGPLDKGTQTEILIGNYGVDGCPCPEKSVCWDI
ncbi:uncharacterized protein LOC135432516 [Drosophila montana]|uniref:uncharacterized protein LOC135432516 n=1 Tax=Drosophila montana TaxID=40370 RepID=UPI00313C4485